MILTNTGRSALFFISLILPPLLFGQSNVLPTLQNQLFELPDVIFEELPENPDFRERYLLRIRQPLDHQNRAAGYFYQRVELSHRGFLQPVVMNTGGYTLSAGPRELVTLLEANYVNVEHRFFGESRPDSLDWRYLTMEQATADLHRINRLLRRIYTSNRWIASGISKGGMTTIYYRYFYPDDVKVSVPYVAPFNRAFADSRIYRFLDSVGTRECRQDILDFQRVLLEREAEALIRLKWFARGKEYTFNYMEGIERAFEYAVLEYPFSFWQMGHDCSRIPAPDAPIDLLLEHFNAVVGLGLYSDEQIIAYGPHYYQAATQMGYYGFETEAFEDLLDALPEAPHAAFVPTGARALFDPTLNESIIDWLKTDAERMLFIYGAIDTWTATAVDVAGNDKVKKFVLPGEDHGSARLRNMSRSMRQKVMAALSDWLNMPLKDPFYP